MSNVTAARGCYSPLKKRPSLPPSEFFKESKAKISMKPKDLAVMNYAHFDGRSNLASNPQVREPQHKVS